VLMISVSVVIPVYNRSSELLRALASVDAQKLKANEVIVVDDGSDINIETLVNRHNPRAKIIRQSHGGVSSARNTGVRHSQNDWIAFLDSDDEWHPEKLTQQTRQLSKTGMLIGHTDEIWIRNGVRVNPQKKHQKSGGRVFSKCLPLCLISPSSVIINKSFLNDIGGFDESLPACEDYDLWLRISAKFTIDYIHKPLITKYGGHGDQLSQKYWGMDRFRIYSMEKIYTGGRLSNDQAIELLKELIKKCNIFSNGANKHNNPHLYSEYAKKKDKYISELDNLMS
ncbi:MAG: glycosyltransferase family 2 protein, partial [Desulfobulbia bacterium]